VYPLPPKAYTASEATSFADSEAYNKIAAQSALETYFVASIACDKEYIYALDDYNLTNISANLPYIN